MIIDMNYWIKVSRKLLLFILSIIGIYLAFKLAIFYMPFLIAFIISLIIEPIVKFLMKHLKLKRKVGAVIVFTIVLTIIVSLLILGISSLISESYNLLNNLNNYFSLITENIEKLLEIIDLNKLNLPLEIINTIKNSAFDVLDTIIEWAKGVLTNLISMITSIPSIIVYIIITLLSLFFITTDKIYMLDMLEHHLPKTWVRKLSKFIKQISSSLGSYLKAQVMLIIVSFIICLIGLYIYKIAGFNIDFPLLSALGIAFVDALPIFGSATAMIPWAIISALNGNIKLAVGLLILLAIMGLTRQMLEPKIVSGQIGIHPIFTLIAMYTGFKFLGVIGLLFGPIILIILKTIFSTRIDKGLAKSIFDRE